MPISSHPLFLHYPPSSSSNITINLFYISKDVYSGHFRQMKSFNIWSSMTGFYYLYIFQVHSYYGMDQYLIHFYCWLVLFYRVTPLNLCIHQWMAIWTVSCISFLKFFLSLMVLVTNSGSSWKISSSSLNSDW